jgi:hypothetical protein
MRGPRSGIGSGPGKAQDGRSRACGVGDAMIRRTLADPAARREMTTFAPTSTRGG